MNAIAQIMSPDDNCYVRRAKRQTIIETWWRRGGLDDDQYRVLDALARDCEARLLSQSGVYTRWVGGRGSGPFYNDTQADAAIDRLQRLSEAYKVIATLREPHVWRLLELVLCDVSPDPVTSVTQAARRIPCCPKRARAILRACADLLNTLSIWRNAAQRTPIWALG